MNQTDFFIFFIAILLLFAPAAGASTYLSLEDDATYSILSRLEAEGVITSGLLDTKPLSRKEVVRLYQEAKTNAEGRSDFVRDLVQSLRERLDDKDFIQGGYVKPLDSMYVKVIDTNADVVPLQYNRTARTTVENEQALNVNNDGDLYRKGVNERAGFVSRLEEAGPLSLFLEPEYRAPNNSEGYIKKGYAVLGFDGTDIIVGKDSQWWGPGASGAILMSDNAKPLTMARITNPRPTELPWLFKYLGPFRYNIFFTTLEKDRPDFAAPYLWGMRFDFKPIPEVEIGLERTALLGGRGRPTDLKLWTRSVFGLNENKTNQEAGDQRAGGDIKITLPFKAQPVQLYTEYVGEDKQAGMPFKKAFIAGGYLPRIANLERLSLRAEYASDHVYNNPDVWYTHGTYFSGYTYHDMIIGHHMGTDSRDYFTELSYLVPEKNSKVSLSYDKETHNLSAPDRERERKYEMEINVDVTLSRNLEILLGYGYGWIINVANTSTEKIYVHQTSGAVTYRF